MSANDERVVVYCTDKGHHARASLGAFVVRAGELTFSTTHTKRAPWPAGAVDADGTAVADKVVMPGRDASEPYNGHARWRLVCQRCGRDEIVTEKRGWWIVRPLLAAGVSAADLSYLPV